MSQPTIMEALWQQYTMTIDLKRPFVEDQEYRMLGKYLTCTPEGILAFTQTDGNPRTNIIFINIHTRCEVNRIVLPRGLELRHLFAVDAKTIVYVGNLNNIDQRTLRANEPRLFAKVIKSDDGFRNMEEFEVTLTYPPSSTKRYPDFCVTLGHGFVFAMRDFGKMFAVGTPIELFYVPYLGVIRSATSTNDRTFASMPIGTMLALGESIRFIAIPYDNSSFAILAGDNGKPRIDLYSIENQGILRSIPVHWPLPTTFPPPIVQVLPGGQHALLQSMTGEKMTLNLNTGIVISLPSFISPVGQKLDLSENIHAITHSEAESVGYEMDEDYVANVEEETPVDDAVYLTPGSTTVDDSVVGWFVTSLSENDDDDEETITLLRLPIEKVHTLSTLASNAICKRMSKKMRMEITREDNPKNIAALVRAIVSRITTSASLDQTPNKKRRMESTDEAS